MKTRTWALLELDDPLPRNSNAYFAGWSRAETLPTSSFTIHQPNGSIKSISLDSHPPLIRSYGGINAPWDSDDEYLVVERFEQGAVESGSSGAPLFDQNKRVVGQLRGGIRGCAAQGPIYFGRLWSSSGYPHGEGSPRYWLDPTDTGAIAIDGRNWNLPPTTGADLDAKSLRLSDVGGTDPLSADLSYGFLDPDGDALTYVASSSDTSKVTATISGSSITLTPVAAGSATITVTATDVGGIRMSATQTFTATVAANRSPEASAAIAGRTLDWNVGANAVDISSAFEDADNDTLTYAASSTDEAVATVEVSQTGAVVTLNVTPMSDGRARVLVTATDAAASNTRATQSFEVVANNRAPVGIQEALSVPTRDIWERDLADIFTDPDGDALVYGVEEIGTGADFLGPLVVRREDDTVKVQTRALGTYTFKISAIDPAGSKIKTELEVSVTTMNTSPFVEEIVSDRSLSVGGRFAD